MTKEEKEEHYDKLMVVGWSNRDKIVGEIKVACGWCKRWKIGGEWVTTTEFDNYPHVSHGICSECHIKLRKEYDLDAHRVDCKKRTIKEDNDGTTEED